MRRRCAAHFFVVVMVLMTCAVVSVGTASAVGPPTCPWYRTSPYLKSGTFYWPDGSSVPGGGTYPPTLEHRLSGAPAAAVLSNFDGSDPVTLVTRPNPFYSVEIGDWSPDGRFALVGAVNNLSGDRRLYVIDATGPSATQVPGTWYFQYTLIGAGGTTSASSWSPDARHVLVRAKTGELGVLDLTTATPTVTATSPFPGNVLAWSGDGTWFAAGDHLGDESAVTLVRRDGAVQRVAGTIPNPFREPRQLAWRPGTNELATLNGTELTVVDADSGAVTTTTLPGTGPLAGPSYSPDGERLAWSDASRTYRMNLTDGTTTWVEPFSPPLLEMELGAPAWSPDGTLLGVSATHATNVDLPNDVGDVALMDATSVVLRRDGVLGATSTPNGYGALRPWPGDWSPDGTVFRASYAEDLPVTGPFAEGAPRNVLQPLDGSTHTVVPAALEWQTCSSRAVPVAPLPGTVAGTVTAASGDPSASAVVPLGGIVVSLVSDFGGAASWQVIATAVTSADGTYTFVDVPSGTYRVKFFDPTGSYQRRWWSAAPSYKASDPLTVAWNETTVADAALAANPGTIRGRTVHGPPGNANQPVAGVSVRVFDKATRTYVTGATTGADGYYQIGGLPPGEYLVQFWDPERRYRSSWLGFVILATRSRPVVVAPGGVAWASTWMGTS